MKIPHAWSPRVKWLGKINRDVVDIQKGEAYVHKSYVYHIHMLEKYQCQVVNLISS